MADAKITLFACTYIFMLCVVLLRQCSCQSLDREGDEADKIQMRRKVKSGFSTARTQVSLTCGSEDILVQVNFTKPFKGLVHAGPKDSSCRIAGDGGRRYQLKVPLKESVCGTHEVQPSGSFANTLTIRFHPSLELEGDEIKTIICRFGTGSLNVG